MDFGKIMLSFRANHKLTQTDLAKILGVASNTIHRIENGKNEPTQRNKIIYENKMKEYEVNKNENVQM